MTVSFEDASRIRLVEREVGVNALGAFVGRSVQTDIILPHVSLYCTIGRYPHPNTKLGKIYSKFFYASGILKIFLIQISKKKRSILRIQFSYALSDTNKSFNTCSKCTNHCL